MLDFFFTVCENYDDCLPMVKPQTNFFFHRCLLIHVMASGLFEINNSAFDIGVDQLLTYPFANIQSLEFMCPLAFNAHNKPSNPTSCSEAKVITESCSSQIMDSRVKCS